MDKIPETEKEWREKLSPEEYHILREKGTEPAFTGKYWNEHKTGIYRCAACGAELFSSEDKFDSGTGWPSFTRPQNEKAVEMSNDTSNGVQRTEVICSGCGSHLGHVFDDGPKTMPDKRMATGKRFCINSASLKLNKE